MQTFSQTFTAATTWKINLPASYFTVLSCSLALNVRFYLKEKLLDLGEIKNVLAGLEVSPRNDKDFKVLGYDFDRVEIDVGGADTVQVGIGNGQARYNRSQGSVAITNTGGAFSTVNAAITSTDQQALPANSARRYLLVQNPHATANLYIEFGAAATTYSLKIGPGQSLEMDTFVPTNAIHLMSDGPNVTVPVVIG